MEGTDMGEWRKVHQKRGNHQAEKEKQKQKQHIVLEAKPLCVKLRIFMNKVITMMIASCYCLWFYNP